MLDVGDTAGSSGLIAAVQGDCAAHRHHEPRPTYLELHHVIPRAWQSFWRPEDPPDPGVYDGQHLWDARTVALCRTGHGNVHHWITALTRAWRAVEERGAGEPTIPDVSRAVRVANGGVGRADFAVAVQALTRFVEAGGSISDLVAAGLWGEI